MTRIRPRSALAAVLGVTVVVGVSLLAASLVSGAGDPPNAAASSSPVGSGAVDPGPSAPSPGGSPTAEPEPSAAVSLADALGSGWQQTGKAGEPRDVDEVMTLVIPLGCEKRTGMPRPTRVLGDTFEHTASRVPAVLLHLRFKTPADAQTFLEARAADLRACAKQPDDPYSGAAPPVTTVKVEDGGLTVSERTDPFEPAKTATWTEFFAAEGREVVGLAVNVGRSNASGIDLDDLPSHVVVLASAANPTS